MLGRTDMKEYSQMCQAVLNALILKQGGGTRRPGTQFQIKSITDQTPTTVVLDANTRVIPFVFSNGEAYIMVLYNNDNAVDGNFGLAMVNVESGVVSATWTTSTPSSGQIQGIFTDLELAGFFQGYTTRSQMNEVQYAQSGDVISLVSPLYYPHFLTRVATDTFIFSDIWSARQVYTSVRNPYGGDQAAVVDALSPSAVPLPGEIWSNIPYTPLLSNTSQTLAVASASVGVQAATWASPNTSQFPDGTLVRVDGSGTTGFGIIQDSGANINILRAFPSTSPSSFQVSMWNTTYGWPETNLFFQQRLLYGGNLNFPDTLWGSQQGDYILIMSVRTLDDPNLNVVSNDRPFQFTIAQNKVSKIQSLQADADLFMFTQSDEWLAVGTDGQTSLGPLNISFNKQTSYGSEPVRAESSDGAMQFVPRGGQGLREVVYVFQENHRLAESLSDYSEHMIRYGLEAHAEYVPAKIVQIAYQALDHNITWCLDANGYLFALTRDRARGVMAWHRHELGGVSNTDEIPTVISICCAPSPNGDSDELWMVVQRTVNGSEVYYIEKMGKPYRFDSMVNSSTDIQDKIVLADCAVLQRLGSPGNVFNNFGHLKLQMVDCLADGNYLGQIQVDSSGNVTLPGPTTYTELIAGLPFESIIQTMPEILGSVMGTADSTIKRIDRFIGRFERTVAASVGPVDDATMQAIAFRDQSVPNGTPTPMFTGTQTIMYGGDYSNDASIIVKTSVCLPFTLTSLTARGLTYEG